eukprot:m.206835 g.206835  ORF g.206835 m.206835 type:complete len:561 (+) comp25368_c0_seq1:95-1777(+)
MGLRKRAAASETADAEMDESDGLVKGGRRQRTLRHTVNPFKNDTVTTRPGWWLVVEVLVGITLGPIRVVVFILAFLIAILFSAMPLWIFSLCSDPAKPRHIGQKIALFPLIMAVRMVLWSFGVWWISVKRMKGCGTNWADTRVIASNHVSLLDPAVIAYMFNCPSIVAKEAVGRMPLIGTISRAMQVIFVNRESANSRTETLKAICDRAKAKDHAPVGIFPEGTCTNGSMLIRFKQGAFAPAEPVQPVVLQYQYPYINPANVGDLFESAQIMWLVVQPWTNVHVTLLPLRAPKTDEERTNPLEFGRGVRDEMAAVLDVPVTEHSTDDFFLYCHANRNRVQLDQAFEASAIKSLFGVDITGLKARLDRFAAADADKNGWLEPSELCTIAGLDPESAEASVLFGFFDTKGTGRVDFAEFVCGIAVLSDNLNEADHLKLAFLIMEDDDGTVSLQALRAYLAKTSAAAGKFDTLTNVDTSDLVTRTSSRASISSTASQLETSTSAILAEEGADVRLTYSDFVIRVRQHDPDVAERILTLTAMVATDLAGDFANVAASAPQTTTV